MNSSAKGVVRIFDCTIVVILPDAEAQAAALPIDVVLLRLPPCVQSKILSSFLSRSLVEMKNLKIFKFAVASTLVLASYSCGGSKKSHLNGHYEESDAAKNANFKNAQRVSAEYAPAQGTIISAPLLNDYDKLDLIKSLMEKGIVWLVVAGNEESTQQQISKYLKKNGANIQNLKFVPATGASYTQSVWARDWSPLLAFPLKKESNALPRMLDLNYYNKRPLDDGAPRALANVESWGRVSVPVYNEGGNFMINSRGDCLMTTRVIDANAKAIKSDDQVLDAQGVSEYYKIFAGCTAVHIFPRMPEEGTGHIDMWAKFLNDDTILMNELSQKTLDTLSGSELATAKKIQKWLTERAVDLEKLGFKIERIPMPAPLYSGGQLVIRSYTNSLLMNGTALIPEYKSPAQVQFTRNIISENRISHIFAQENRKLTTAKNIQAQSWGVYPDSDYLPEYTASVKAAYEKFGFKAAFFESDDLIFMGGAIHCVTMQVPRL